MSTEEDEVLKELLLPWWKMCLLDRKEDRKEDWMVRGMNDVEMKKANRYFC